MEKEYEVITNPMGQTCIRRTSDGVFIPVDESNADYQAYLEWKATQDV